MRALVKLLVLLAGGHIRCGSCGHRVNLTTMFGHVRFRHPEALKDRR